MIKKSKTRIFVDKKLSSNVMIYIKEKQHHFLKNVLRLKINQEISVFDNQTGEWQSRIMSINRDNTVLQILKKTKDLIFEPDIWLFFAPIKQFRLNITIQKATELGISKFIPCSTNFTNNSFLNYKNLKLNIIEAAEQCERLTIPSLENLVTFEKFIKNHPTDRALIFCNENLNYQDETMFESINRVKNKFKKWSLLIGPEGGFSSDESEKLTQLKNTIPVSLGKRVLRSDTATVAALFCIQSIIDI
tara:strand:- start:31 stop:771 length:741 start_codon:yes stop_codon:yes gene_type:complete